ncbi:hypothetical protein KKH23_07000 [Patescibacteria group bacterium]|nr:hypothetical protein [Patescibacteria group bacterium]
MSIEITVRGFEAIRYLVGSIPEKIPLAAIEPTLKEVLIIGIETMRLSVMRTTGEKATGHLADSIEGTMVKSQDGYKLQVGSSLPYAKYPAMDIAATDMSRGVHSVIPGFNQRQAVQILPGMRWAGYMPTARWRFIGIRPPMPKHPFIDDAANAMTVALGDLFGRNLDIQVSEVASQTKELENVEERIQ